VQDVRQDAESVFGWKEIDGTRVESELGKGKIRVDQCVRLKGNKFRLKVKRKYWESGK